MKKLKYLIVVILLCFSGCTIGYEDFSDDNIYATIYPIEYATQMIYGKNANVKSIYPDGTNYKDFKITDKLMNTYSKGDTFLYSGLSNENLIARDLLNKNNKLEIVDAMKGMTYSKSFEELWLDPSNFLMMCRNIKSTLIDYEDKLSVKEDIEENYQKLKESISILDVDIYNLGKNGNYKTILATDNVFNYLSKYDINVISIDPENEKIDKALSDAKKEIGNKNIKYIYTLKGVELSTSINTFINDYKLVRIEIDPFTTMTNEQRINGENYITLMNKIIDELKKELFK